jgi:hypothetical protein
MRDGTATAKELYEMLDRKPPKPPQAAAVKIRTALFMATLLASIWLGSWKLALTGLIVAVIWGVMLP